MTIMDLSLYTNTEYPLDFDDEQELGQEASEEDYDAINEETFGVEVNDDIAELEEFANQTAHLRLDEISAPHPSQLPLPDNFKDEKQPFLELFTTHNDENLISKSLSRLVGAKTIDEIEREQLKLVNTSKPTIWNASSMPPVFPTGAPITAEELERKILLESANLSISPSIRPPPFTPQTFAQLQQQLQAPPPGFLPHQLSIYSRPPPGFFIPPPTTLAGMSSSPNIPPLPFPPNLQMPPENSIPFVPPSVLFMQGIPPPNMKNLRPKRKEGMPSVRTISDFACDPYAGFMSKKEREWLIKIQIIQCLGSGDPSEDDFYYFRWKNQRVLEQLPESMRMPKEKAKYYSIDDVYPSNYIPPTFAGSLGKPSFSSTSFPRPLIEMHSNPEEDEHKGAQNSSQKKLRALLMQIENASLMLLDCNSIRHKIKKADTTEKDENYSALNSKLDTIVESVVTEEHLPMIMLVQKGRHLLGRLIEFSDVKTRQVIINVIFDTIPKYNKKLDADAQSNTLFASISNAISQLNNDDFQTFFDSISISQISALLSLQFTQQFIMALLIGLSTAQHSCFSSNNKCNLCSFLLSKLKLPPKFGLNFKSTFTNEEMLTVQTWLGSKFVQHGNLAELLVHSLLEIKLSI